MTYPLPRYGFSFSRELFSVLIRNHLWVNSLTSTHSLTLTPPHLSPLSPLSALSPLSPLSPWRHRMTLEFVIYAAEFQRNKTNDQPSNEKIRITPNVIVVVDVNDVVVVVVVAARREKKRQTLLRRPFNFNPNQLFLFLLLQKSGKSAGTCSRSTGRRPNPWCCQTPTAPSSACQKKSTSLSRIIQMWVFVSILECSF